jgi:hypothetical protein
LPLRGMIEARQQNRRAVLRSFTATPQFVKNMKIYFFYAFLAQDQSISADNRIKCCVKNFKN